MQANFDKRNDSSIHSIIELRNIYNQFVSKLNESDKVKENDVLAKDLVDIYTSIHISCLILEETKSEERKIVILNRYIKSALANAKKGYENLMIGTFDDLDKKDIICQIYE